MQNTDPGPVQEDALAALADAVKDRSQPLRPSPPPPTGTLSPGWRFVIFLMRTWAAILFGIGLLFCILAMISKGGGAPVFRIERTEHSVQIYGWGLSASLAVLAFLWSKLQSLLARRLRARKLAASITSTPAASITAGSGR